MRNTIPLDGDRPGGLSYLVRTGQLDDPDPPALDLLGGCRIPAESLDARFDLLLQGFGFVGVTSGRRIGILLEVARSRVKQGGRVAEPILLSHGLRGIQILPRFEER